MTLPLRIDEPLSLPEPRQPARRPAWPFFASLVPVLGGAAMWFVTRSPLSLCFAAIGPLMAIASFIDGRRTARRDRRRADAADARACAEIGLAVAGRHDREQEELHRQRPGTLALAADERRVWRSEIELVVGTGQVPSRVRVTGGSGERAAAVRASAAVLDDAPIAIDASEGVCVRGDPVIAWAVARSLLVQLCLRAGPRALTVVAVAEDWADALPHRRASEQSAFRVALVSASDADAAGGASTIAVAASGEAPPPDCGVVIELDRVDGRCVRGTLHRGAQEQDVAVEALSAAQAASIAAVLAERVAERTAGADGPVLLAELEPIAAADGAHLPAVIGTAAGTPVSIDLVSDGPHALVVGTTGAGKSELLITLVASLARTYTTERVVFLLADFKGGTSFDPLAGLPHVTGVITDLDGETSRRAVEGLRAELRRREGRLAAVGARDVTDQGVGLPRLVIVVDEFAAMLGEHPDLHAVFTDIAARGRALGMHLVLGTQRATGTVRDGLVANCPLRIALRVAERAESRCVIGTDAAAELPGGEQGRGVAYVRRAGDTAPVRTRIALTAADLIAGLSRSGSPRPAGPWLPPLPGRLALSDARVDAEAPAGERGVVVLGIADDPDHQRQPAVLLRPRVDRGLVIVGGGGSGKSTAARIVAAQVPGAVVVPRTAEGAWDAVERADADNPPLLVIDDLDAVIARFPHEHAQAMAERIEHLVRDAGERRMTVVVTVARLTGQLTRIVDLIPRRALLALATRADHAAAGGDAASFDPRRPPGRATLDGREMQFALDDAPPDGERPEPLDAPDRVWCPVEPLTALVVRAARARARTLSAGWGSAVRVVVLGEGADDPPPAAADGTPVVIVGDAETWQRQWALLQRARAELPIVVGAECVAEVRAITGERELPPYARTRASRAWLFSDGHPPERIVLPS